MTLSLRAGFALLATTAALAGCSTAPTITVPNPLAALNGVFAPAPAPRVASAPTYTAAPGMYEQVAPASYGSIVPTYTTTAPSYDTASYGSIGQTYSSAGQAYSSPSIDTGMYSTGTVAPSYSAASGFDSGTYTLGSVASAPAPSYSSDVPTFGTLASSAPSYSMAAPVMESASYVSDAATFGEPMTDTSSYSQGYGMSQPIQASGTTYDLTAPSMGATLDPAAGLTVDTGYGILSAPVPPMGGSFQVVPPTVSGGVATYSSSPTVLDGGTFSY